MNRSKFQWLMVRRALSKKAGKSALIVLAVAMGASVAAALLNLEVDLRQRMNRELRDYGPNVLVTPAAEFTAVDDRVLPALQRGVAEKRLLAFTPEVFVPGKAEGVETIIVGADLPSLRKLFPGWSWSSTADGVYLGARLAKKLKAGPGSDILIDHSGNLHQVKVAGLVEGGEAEDDQVLVSWTLAPQMGVATSRIQVVAVSALGELPDVEAWFSANLKPVRGVSFEVVRRIAAAETQILDKISRLMTLILAIIFVTLFFCINTTISAILLSRQAEIALMRVLGARRKQIMYGLTLELLTLAAVGGLLGYVIGMIMAQVLGNLLFQTFVVPRVSVFIVTMLSAPVMILVSSLLPIRRAINRPAALVLKEA